MKEGLGSGLFIVSSHVSSRSGLCNRHNSLIRYRRICIHPGYGFHCLLSGKVIVKVTVNIRVFLQIRQCPFQITDRVHNKVVTGGINANGTIVRLF